MAGCELGSKSHLTTRCAQRYEDIVKTIAVTIDEATLRALDRFTASSGRAKKGRARHGNRSELVRQALQEFLARREQEQRERAEWEIWEQHIDQINRQAALLVAEQAEP